MHSTSFTEHNARFDWSLSARQQAIVDELLDWSIRFWLWTDKLVDGYTGFWKQRWKLTLSLTCSGAVSVGYVIFADASGRFQYRPAMMAAAGVYFAAISLLCLYAVLSAVREYAKGCAWLLANTPRLLHTASAARSAWETWEEDTPPSPASGDNGGVSAESPLFLEQEEIV
jgi:hypothetical protein